MVHMHDYPLKYLFAFRSEMMHHQRFVYLSEELIWLPISHGVTRQLTVIKKIIVFLPRF